MEEQTPTPEPKKGKMDSYMAILIVLTVALVFAWVFYFYYIFQTEEVTFEVTVKAKGGIEAEIETVDKLETETVETEIAT